jgi:photosystem II stability/assembly factor-like uncharacterized protein
LARGEGPVGLLGWTRRGIFVVAANGALARSTDLGRSWTEVGEVSGVPAAFEAAEDRALYVALHDGTVKRSTDGGRSWTVRASP